MHRRTESGLVRIPAAQMSSRERKTNSKRRRLKLSMVAQMVTRTAGGLSNGEGDCLDRAFRLLETPATWSIGVTMKVNL